MKVAGRAVSPIGKKLLLIRCDGAQLPPLHGEVSDGRMRPVGRILDIFGNIKAPYAIVLCRDKCMITPEERLYLRQK